MAAPQILEYLEPAVTAVVAAGVLGEAVTLYTWLGGAAIVAGRGW